jgi:hypothetical protein
MGYGAQQGWSASGCRAPSRTAYNEKYELHIPPKESIGQMKPMKLRNFGLSYGMNASYEVDHERASFASVYRVYAVSTDNISMCICTM